MFLWIKTVYTKKGFDALFFVLFFNFGRNSNLLIYSFNNMIPIHPDSLTKVEMKILKTDSKQDADYKNLLSNQLSWCNAHRSTILNQAQKLYQTITQGKAWDHLAGRCCNFALDERQLILYCQEKSGQFPNTFII